VKIRVSVLPTFTPACAGVKVGRNAHHCKTQARSISQGMDKLFEELDYRETPIGPIALRRRKLIGLGTIIYEVILGDEHLMSSLFTASEIALAHLGIEALTDTKDPLDIIVGGLGLGYTAGAVLEHANVATLKVVELLPAMIDWHAQGLLPLDPPLSADDRCEIIEGDFFALAESEAGFSSGQKFHAILIDIDHTPDWLLDARSGSFYSEAGLKKLARHLRPGGVMGLWSDAREDADFTERLGRVFSEAWAEPVEFHNPLQDKMFTQTVYLGRK